MKDYARDRPGIQMSYYGNYASKDDEGNFHEEGEGWWSYGIYAYLPPIVTSRCKECGTPQQYEHVNGMETGQMFWIETEEE